MNAAQLAMIAAYAQQMTADKHWTFNPYTACYEWQSKAGIDYELAMGEEGYTLDWMPREDDAEPLPVQSVKHLLALTQQ